MEKWGYRKYRANTIFGETSAYRNCTTVLQNAPLRMILCEHFLSQQDERQNNSEKGIQYKINVFDKYNCTDTSLKDSIDVHNHATETLTLPWGQQLILLPKFTILIFMMLSSVKGFLSIWGQRAFIVFNAVYVRTTYYTLRVLT